jgi:hypothetical protein
MGFVVSVSVLIAGFVWGMRLITAPAPFDGGSGALLGISLVIGAAVATLGLVLARGRWARRLALGLLAVQVGLAVVMDLAGWGIVALGATAASIVLVAGPWLDGFLRRLPPAEPIPPAAMTLGLGLIVVPGILAATSPGGVEEVHWAAALISLATAWAFARALRVGLWSARTIVPVLLVAAGVASTLVGALASMAMAVGVAALAWSPSVNRAVTPLLARADGVAVPPQLVSPELLARAGYDDRGRPSRPKR